MGHLNCLQKSGSKAREVSGHVGIKYVAGGNLSLITMVIQVPSLITIYEEVEECTMFYDVTLLPVV